jgi:hypothetical protein
LAQLRVGWLVGNLLATLVNSLICQRKLRIQGKRNPACQLGRAFNGLLCVEEHADFLSAMKKDGLSRPFRGRAQVPKLAANYSE